MDDEKSDVARIGTPDIEPAAKPVAKAADVLALLDRILASPQFTASAQLRAFLDYVVREELAGRGEKIKAYTVAIDALGRAENFDPSADPVIRVVANRLRKALDQFYVETEDIGPVRIDLVKGNYRPLFQRVEPARKTVPEAPPSAEIVDQQAASGRPGPLFTVVLVVLMILLLIAFGYIGWHFVDHYQHMQIINEVPPELATPQPAVPDLTLR